MRTLIVIGLVFCSTCAFAAPYFVCTSTNATSFAVTLDSGAAVKCTAATANASVATLAAGGTGQFTFGGTTGTASYQQ